MNRRREDASKCIGELFASHVIALDKPSLRRCGSRSAVGKTIGVPAVKSGLKAILSGVPHLGLALLLSGSQVRVLGREWAVRASRGRGQGSPTRHAGGNGMPRRAHPVEEYSAAVSCRPGCALAGLSVAPHERLKNRVEPCRPAYQRRAVVRRGPGLWSRLSKDVIGQHFREWPIAQTSRGLHLLRRQPGQYPGSGTQSLHAFICSARIPLDEFAVDVQDLRFCPAGPTIDASTSLYHLSISRAAGDDEERKSPHALFDATDVSVVQNPALVI